MKLNRWGKLTEAHVCIGAVNGLLPARYSTQDRLISMVQFFSGK